MPLLMCPNDNAAMQTLQRGGVEFDMCPTCRGVWLDRGELEKLMSMAREDTPPPSAPPPGYPPQQSQPWGGDHRPPPQPGYERPRYDDRRYDDDRRHHGDYKHGYHKKKKGFDLFDIFD